jgi:molecular chaperone IbpA
MISLYKEIIIMTQLVRFDTTALNKALVGFDKMFDDFEHRFANQVTQAYPPYNIVKTDEDTYEIQIAVSGFDKDDVSVEIDQNQLIIKGINKAEAAIDIQYLHRGLAARDFTRVFTLAEHMIVGEGRIKNGILSVAITRVIPEALKPRIIQITTE